MKLFSFIQFKSIKDDLNNESGIWKLLEAGIVFFFIFFPLLFDLPYRDNLYLSWEGTYRLYLGQIPYKDYGMPIGVGYFLIPLLFFKIFGPFMRTLLYAQVLINFITILFFRGIFKNLGLSQTERLLSLLVFIVSYTFSFFWPWYNNTAFMFELGSLFFILQITQSGNSRYYSNIFLASLFSFLSFFTKQDYGGIALFFSIVILTYTAYNSSDYKRISIFGAFLFIIAGLIILPLLQFDFLYWFNYGQAPHESRIHASHFMDEFFANSSWEKFYIVLMVFLFIEKWPGFRRFLVDRNQVLLFLICFGMVIQNLITKVTSRLPLESTTYFHGFAFAYVISQLRLANFFKKRYSVIVSIILIFVWWSSIYWKYANRIFKFNQGEMVKNKETEFVGEPWRSTPFRVYSGINLPISTINGIDRLKRLPLFNTNKQPRILNMSELTPLAYELKFLPQPNLPLWYHLNIGMFDKEVKEINKRVHKGEYDIVLFEVVPGLDNFYPFEVRDQLLKDYVKIDSFMAPRKAGDSHIEIFIKK